MLLLLLLTFTAYGEDYRFHIFESDVHLPVECLPKEARELLSKRDRRVHVKELYEYNANKPKERIGPMVTRFVQLDSSKEITKACGLAGVQAYSEGRLQPVTGDFHFQVVEDETGSDCQYEVPRLEAKLYGAAFRKAFLLGPGFSVLKGAERKAAEKSFLAAAAPLERTANWLGAPQGYFLRTGEPGVVYVVVDLTEMGTKMALYRGQGKKWKEVAFADYPPCGS